MQVDYEYSVDWFSRHIEIWTELFAKILPSARKVLEIGAFEGRATVWLVENVLQPGATIFCVDSWQGGFEHSEVAMNDVERRFDKNIEQLTLDFPGRQIVKRKGLSQVCLYQLVAEGHAGTFDFVYVDGSHQAPDVLSDLVSAYHLCRQGGLIVCDDYLWAQGENPLLTPKIAIDAFVNCYFAKVNVLSARLYQMYMLKK